MGNLRWMSGFYEPNENDKYIAKCIFEKVEGVSRSICDFGFGNTLLAENLERSNFKGQYIGIDYDNEAVNNAQFKGRGDNIRFVLGDMLEYDGSDFDCCICSRVFHHFNKKDAILAINKMVRTISTQGMLIVVDSLRDYGNRKDRFLYLPYFFMDNIIEAYKKINGKSQEVDIKSTENSASMNQYWLLACVINAEKISFSVDFLDAYEDGNFNSI